MDGYRFKAELQNEISQLKITEHNETYVSKESEFLQKVNRKLMQRERDLQKEVDKCNKMGEKLQDLINENDRLKKSNVENQSKIYDREVEYKQKSEEYKSIISKQEEEIKNLNEKLNEMKTENLFMKESLCCRKCNGIQMPLLHIEEVPNSTHHVVQDPNTVDKFVTVNIVASLDETVSKCENEEETRDSRSLEDCTGININKCSTSAPIFKNKESKRRPNRRRKEVNNCELEESSKMGTSKQTDGVNLQNMDPNIEELAVRSVASEDSPFKKPKAPKKRNSIIAKFKRFF